MTRAESLMDVVRIATPSSVVVPVSSSWLVGIVELARRGSIRPRYARPGPSEEEAMVILDATQIDDPVTRDEALALAIYYSRPGDTLTQHRPGCPAETSARRACTCVPMTLRLGARA